MENTERAVFKFGKIDYTGSGKRYPVEIEMKLRNRHGYNELSVCGTVWNTRHTDCVMAGQCLDELNEYNALKCNAVFQRIYLLWKSWHLNGMHAGTEEQEAFLNRYKEANEIKYLDYDKACELLKSAGLYEVKTTCLTSDGTFFTGDYKYGSRWLVRSLPMSVLIEICGLINKRNAGYINDKGIEVL